MLLLEGRAAGAAEFRPLATDLAALWASDAHCGRSHRLWHLAYRRHRGVSCRKGCLVPRNARPDYPVTFLGVSAGQTRHAQSVSPHSDFAFALPPPPATVPDLIGSPPT